ncbi:MAG TPA: VOC family protein [Gaiellaceae bacterium]|nr:VOC family protein [Gaiellaceae bacterium]
MTDVVPFLAYEDVAAAADWLVRAFGFEEIERFEEDGAVGHVTLRAGDGLIFLGSPPGYASPRRLCEQSDAVARVYETRYVVDGVFVRVADLDAHAAAAQAAGAHLLTEPEDSPRGRLYRVEDPEGHRWMFEG